VENVLVILGPTASGKTKISVDLAKLIHGEIISADSMQIYKHMDIGTAKPKAEEMCGIKHYMIDEVFPNEEFSVASFQKLAENFIECIISKNMIPIVSGGTGLYINSLLYNINFSQTTIDWGLRERLKKEAEEKGNTYLHEKLKEIDPEAASKIHQNNVKRVIRAIEVFEGTNHPISYHNQISRLIPSKYNFIKIGLNMDRKILYERINQRVDLMIDKGLVKEVSALLTLGYNKLAVALQGLGYKEIISYLEGEITLDKAVENIKKGTRNYAKRQMTWFKTIDNVLWVEVDKYENYNEILRNLKNHIETYGII